MQQEDTLPFSLPERAGSLGAPLAGCQLLIMAPRLSVPSPTWQLAITKESGPRSWVTGAVSQLAAGRLSTLLLPAACPGHLSAALGRAPRSYFGVTPTRKAAESQPCWARCCARRGMTAPCPKETRSVKKNKKQKTNRGSRWMFGSTWPGQVLGMGKQQGLGAEPMRYPDGVALLIMQIVRAS